MNAEQKAAQLLGTAVDYALARIVGKAAVLAAALEYAAEVLVEESLDKFEPPEDFSTRHADRLGAMKTAVEGDIRRLREYAEMVRKFG